MSLAGRTARNTALVVAARLLSKVLVFVVVLLAIRSQGQENYGRFSSLVVYAGLVSIIADLGFRPLFTREVARDHTRLTPYLNSILSLKLVLALPALGVLALAIRLALPSLFPYVLPTFALLIATSFSNQLRATFYALGELRFEAFAILGESVVLLAGALVVVLAHFPWWTFLWVYAVSYGFTVVYAAVVAATRLGHSFAFDLDWRRLRMLGRESLPFAMAFIIVTLYYRVDVAILKIFTTFAAVGVYSAAYKYLDAVSFLPQTLMDPIYPSLSMLAHQNRERLGGAIVKVYKMLAVAALPVAAGLVIFAQPIVEYMIPGFDPAISVLRVLGLGIVFLFLNNIFIYTLNAMGRQADATRLALMSLVLNVLLNFILIPLPSPLYGSYMGAAWATVLTEIGLFVGGWFLLRRHLVAVPIFSSLKGVLPAGLLMAAAMAGVTIALGPHLYSYALALALGVTAYLGGLFVTHAFTPEEVALAREATRSLTRR